MSCEVLMNGNNPAYCMDCRVCKRERNETKCLLCGEYVLTSKCIDDKCPECYASELEYNNKYM